MLISRTDKVIGYSSCTIGALLQILALVFGISFAFAPNTIAGPQAGIGFALTFSIPAAIFFLLGALLMSKYNYVRGYICLCAISFPLIYVLPILHA